MVQWVDVQTFKQDNAILADRSVILAIKNFERHEVRKRVLARQQGHGAEVPPSPPRDGVITKVQLNTSQLDDASIKPGTFEICKSPYQCLMGQDCHYFNAFDRVIKRTPFGALTFYDSLTKRVHSIDLDNRSGDLLISSSGFDVIHRLDSSFRLRNVYSIWQALPKVAVRNGRQHSLCGFEYPYNGKLPIYEIDPENKAFVKGLGVGESPFYVSGASFSRTGQILYTGYHAPSIFITDFQDTVEYNLDLKNPHSFVPLGIHWGKNRYCVLDSGRGAVLFLDINFNPVERLSLETIEKKWDEHGNEEWMQSLCVMEDDDAKVLLIADQIRQIIHILDIGHKKRRAISYPDSWSLHGIYVDT